QIEYHNFFPQFADELTKELGQFLGDPTAVALCPAEGEFSFDFQYRHAGLGFEQGKYRIPLMIRLKNLEDDGELLIRLKLYFVKKENSVLAWAGDEKPVTFEPSKLDVLLDAIYKHLTDLLSSSAWFEINPSHYQGTRIGFGSGNGAV
ncbi:MAG: hypothetical protein K2Q97_15875, partial [Burkholderiaceae bacterium]|nr:hypothetical protein [Burkholderiaceae bacterium]